MKKFLLVALASVSVAANMNAVDVDAATALAKDTGYKAGSVVVGLSTGAVLASAVSAQNDLVGKLLVAGASAGAVYEAGKVQAVNDLVGKENVHLAQVSALFGFVLGYHPLKALCAKLNSLGKKDSKAPAAGK